MSEWLSLSDRAEGVFGDGHVAPPGGDSFERELVGARLNKVGIETEGEPFPGIRLQVTRAPDALVVSRQERGAVGLKAFCCENLGVIL